ncbi:MAG: glycosyltransferase [Clostridia bacterium]|nr:glycosyltransferase [Clostridia bacterium]
MKKILFAAYSLDIGGIEKALVSLTNRLQQKGYEITIVLEKKQGIFLEEIDPKIHIIQYAPDESKNILKRKVKNLIKRIKFSLKYKNKFDFSVCFATYSNVASFVSRTASKNSCLWGHADYLTLFENQEEKVKEFFKEKKYNQFKKVVFVSKEGRESFIKIFPEMKQKTIVCNNLIEAETIQELAKQTIELKKDKEKFTFLNVGRHDEKQKKLTRMITAAKKLKEEKYKFKILLVGDGPDNQEYKNLVKKEKLEDVILFLGKKQNPYPYFEIADCVVLSSDYEGYPVVFLESFILNKPIITTKVSDYEEVEQGYGMVTEKTEEDIYKKMKQMLEDGFTIKKQFDSKKYNQEIIEKIERIING